MSVQSINNLLLPSITDNRVVMNPKFAADQTLPLNITFEDFCRLEILATDNAAKLLPTVLIQGDYYSNGDFGEEPSEIVDYDAITDEEIDEMFDAIFGTGDEDDTSEGV